MKYIAKTDFEMLNKLFLEGEELHVGESTYVMNGRIDYGRNVYKKGEHIGMIRNSYFEKEIKYKLQRI